MKIEKNSFYIYQYTFIDSFDFIKNPNDIEEERLKDELPDLDMVKEYLGIAGWEGDGEFGVIWIPPFCIEGYTDGIWIWHVKQKNNGVSWLASKRDFVTSVDFTDLLEHQ